MRSHHVKLNSYLKDLDLSRTDGDLLPSSSKRLGFDSLDEKCRCIERSSSAAMAPIGTKGAAAWDEVLAKLEGPIVTPAAPSRCNLSWDEHCD